MLERIAIIVDNTEVGGSGEKYLYLLLKEGISLSSADQFNLSEWGAPSHRSQEARIAHRSQLQV